MNGISSYESDYDYWYNNCQGKSLSAFSLNSPPPSTAQIAEHFNAHNQSIVHGNNSNNNSSSNNCNNSCVNSSNNQSMSGTYIPNSNCPTNNDPYTKSVCDIQCNQVVQQIDPNTGVIVVSPTPTTAAVDSSMKQEWNVDDALLKTSYDNTSSVSNNSQPPSSSSVIEGSDFNCCLQSTNNNFTKSIPVSPMNSSTSSPSQPQPPPPPPPSSSGGTCSKEIEAAIIIQSYYRRYKQVFYYCYYNFIYIYSTDYNFW
ncbi:unnamed protein product [Trichobilharzia regenti]|nr:unnamed protein product [Trichobilharzia regenti]